MEPQKASTALRSATRLLLFLSLAVLSGSICLVSAASPANSMGDLSNMAVVWSLLGPLLVVGLLGLKDAWRSYSHHASRGLSTLLAIMAASGLAAVIGGAGAVGLLSGSGTPGAAGPMAVLALIAMSSYVVIGASILSSARRVSAPVSGRR